MTFSLRILRAGAFYDLLATLPFATPWTARALLRTIAHLEFDEDHLLFVVLFGTVVVMWSLFRLLRPSKVALTLDTLGRVFFATWMMRALALGSPHIVVVFLVLEVFFLALQAVAVFRWRT